MACLILDILRKQPPPATTHTIPVWLMRQAGRYMPEYRKLKEKHGFLGLCRSPELATEVTLQPIRRFAPDAAILFADIMLPAECLGFSIEFAPGPVVKNAIETPEHISDLPASPELKKVEYVFEAVARIKQQLQEFTDDRGRKALFGFAAAPWTLACYLLRQEPYKHFAGTSIFAARFPEAFEQLMDTLCTLTIDYCLAQVRAGADAIQIFDSWAGLLSNEDYQRLSRPHVQRLLKALEQVAPVIYFAHGAAHLMPQVTSLEVSALGLDWRCSLAEIAKSAPEKTLQGNLDPSLLFADEATLSKRIEHMLQDAPHGRYIANLGHGVLQKTPMERVAQFISTIQNYK